MKPNVSKRIFSTLLALAMVIGLIPAMGTTTMAAPGGSAMDPVICDTFAEFKAAMEDPDIIYVSLHAVDEVLPLLDEGRCVAAITVVGDKDLYLANDSVATFVANANGGVYDSLLQVGAGSSLSIDGNRGWLVFEAVGTAAHNAVIYNEGGDVSIYDGYLKGHNNTATYGRAIWQDSGTLTIQDGDFESTDGTFNKVGSKETCAVYLAGGEANIYGGKFHVEETKDPEAKPYGLYIDEEAEVEISGGIFYGVRPPDNTAVGNYIADGCEMTIGGVLVNPMLYGIIDDTKRVTVGHNLVIDEIKSKIAKDNVARAGMEVRTFMPTVPDGAPYSRPWNGASWHDEHGVVIDAPEGQHYDNGYQFEAGRTYYADYQYTTEYGYVFAENPTITLTGPDPSMFTYEIIDRSDDGTEVTVRYTFTIPGEFDYPDINKVSLIYIGGYAEGAQKPNWAELIYNNCTMTREEWNAGTWGSECDWEIDGKGLKHFKGGKTYVHMIELTAKDGYKFSEDLLVQKGDQYDEEIGEVVLSNDRTVATVTYTYTIAGMEYLDTVRLDPKAGDNDFYLIRGDRNLTSGVPFTTYYKELAQPDLPYEVQNSYEWYDVETGEEMRYGVADQDLELGKQYRLEFNIDIKDECYDTVRFSDDTELLIDGYLPGLADYVKIETVTSYGAGQIKVKITYTVQPKAGEGKTAGNPVICYNYNEFKYAMENPDIRYVALGNINETLPVGEVGLVTAIKVKGIKNLQLLGDATFTAPAMVETTYAALLHTTYNTTLNISGAGSLTFKAVANSSFNAVIYNQGGSINVDSGTLVGSYNTAVYGSAIWQEYGELRIKDGQFLADNAMAPLSLPTPMSAVILYGGQAWIEGGTFRMRNWITTIDQPYGLQIGKDATVDLSGGTYYGILLPTDSTPLANYMDEDFYTALTDESKFNPASVYSQKYTASGNVVRIAWFVNHVDVHVNAPMAGVDITENYFNIPTSGCQATMYYPQWYKNGEPVTYGTFEAGASYKVVVQIEVKPGYGAEFATGVTAAINNNAVAVDRKSAHWIEVEYDFGVCPNVISLVELTVTAPKEGNKPSYTVGLGSDAYKLVGNYNNYKDYRQWYMSSDGDEWWPINDTHTFMSGYYYKFVMDVQTASGYQFPLIDNGTIQPDVSATVNGYYARVIKAYDQDPSTYVTVEYNFGECNDSVVEKIAIVDVKKPEAGERPTYIYNILGSGYQMNTAKNAYKDIYWTNPTEKWYYIKNGIGWYDLTDDDWVYEHETFIPGHEYRVYVYLITEDGYEFAYTAKQYENAVTATMNGNTAEVEIWDGYWADQRRVKYTFTCEKKDISTVILSGLEAPKGGELPDHDIVAAYPEFYTVAYVYWYDEEGYLLYGDDTFRAGETYKVEIKIVPTQIGGINAAQFVSPVKAYLNGAEVTERLDWDAVYTSSGNVYVYYTFTEPAAGSATNATVSGLVTTGGNEADDVTIQLIPQGSDEAEYGIVQSGNSVEYFFFAVKAGTYTLKVMKNGHETYVTELVVGSTNIIHNVTLTEIAPAYIPGDVDGNGKINNRDLGLMQKYLNGSTADIIVAAADMDGNGKVNNRDLGLLQKKLNN